MTKFQKVIYIVVAVCLVLIVVKFYFTQDQDYEYKYIDYHLGQHQFPIIFSSRINKSYMFTPKGWGEIKFQDLHKFKLLDILTDKEMQALEKVK